MARRWSAIAGIALACAVAGCGVRAPAQVDVAGLVRKHGPIEARRALEAKILADSRDIAARLALAGLDEQVGRPSAAIAQLEQVLALGGPLGTRWHASDRERFARLLLARAKVRIARESPAALGDLERARTHGARVDERDLAGAKRARAIAWLRHVDAKQRARGLRLLGELAATSAAEPSWRGARATASLVERAELGIWLWRVGARRAAWDALAAWHDGTRAPQQAERLQGAYLIARAWWSPSDAAPPPPHELVGPERCRFRGAACDPWLLVFGDGADAPSVAALAAAPHERTTSPTDALAWLSITLMQALRGEVAWGPAFASRVELAAVPSDKLPAGLRAAFAWLAHRDERDHDTTVAASMPPATRMLIAAARALRGGTGAEVRAALGTLEDTVEGRALLRVVAPPAPAPVARPYVAALAGYVRARVPGAPDAAVLTAIADGYARDPLIADRLGRDAVAEAVDAAAAHAALGAMFDALADPARARAAWQAAVDASPEAPFVRGLAEALARAHDPDAALVVGTAAAAASGDPAVVWLEVARGLHGTGEHVHALEAARTAIDLAGPAVHAAAVDLAVAASRALGRVTQVEALLARRATISPPVPAERDDDPTDAAAALAPHRARPTISTAARLWLASRWNPRDVAVRAALLEWTAIDDPRRPVLEAELVGLAADRDAERARAAIAALRSSARR